jgi:hypothetical protein
MQWTKCQSQLREEITRPARKGVSLKLIMCEGGSGVSALANYLVRETKEGNGPRVLRLVAAGPNAWEPLQQLEALAGTGTREASHGRSALNSLKALSNNGERQIVLLAESAEYMAANEMARLVTFIEWAADTLDVSVQLCLFFKQILHYEPVTNERGRDVQVRKCDYPEFPELFKDRFKGNRLSMSKFERTGLEQLTRVEAKQEIARLAAAS